MRSFGEVFSVHKMGCVKGAQCYNYLMINASNFAYRVELDRHVQTLAVENLAIEERIISGTIEELKKLSLSHGQNVYGMRVVAIDYKVSNVTPFQKRGDAVSRIDGRAIKIK